MEKQNDNRDQIIRKDARNCFVEVKNDCFHLDKVHLQFVAYDKSRPAGQRYTSNIHIYIDVPQFLAFAKEAANGSIHMRMQQYKNERKSDALYEHLGGTSAKRLAYYGKSRPDGKSLSRVVKLTTAEKSDYSYRVFFRKQSYRVTECQMALLRCLALFCFLPAKCGLKYIISGRENLQKGELRYVENDRHRSCCVQGL